MALRFGFLTTHQLPLAYDFHNYMLRSMEEEFRDIVGISVPLWIFGIACILLGFHGTNIYFWLSFLPAILILLVGTKLHHIVVKLAVEIMGASPWGEAQKFNLRDELFWFRKPRLLLRLIQFVSFQNAFEMASFLWSLWEIKEGSCFTKKHSFLVIRLTFGVVSQIWCSFVTFPLYVIITQMGSTFKKTIISKNVRNSLHGWQRRVKARQGEHPFTLLNTLSPTSLDSTGNNIGRMYAVTSNRMEGCSSRYEDTSVSCQHDSLERDQNRECSSGEKLQVPLYPSPSSNTFDDNYNDELEKATNHFLQHFSNMDSKFLFLISVPLFFISLPLLVEPAKITPQITVMGIVYCDVCSNNTFSRNSYFLPGAEVKIDCRFEATSPRTTEQITFSVNRTTNKHGVYKLGLPAVDGIECARDKSIGNLCRASLMGSSNAACNVPGYKSTTDEITIKSEQENICIYSLNPMNFRPSQRDIALCGN